MFFKISGACSLAGLKFSSSCSLGTNHRQSTSGDKNTTATERTSLSSQRAVNWLSDQLHLAYQAASNGAAWMTNTWKSCKATVINKGALSNQHSPINQKTTSSFAAAIATPKLPIDHTQKFAQATLDFAHELCAKLAHTQPADKSFAISPVSLLAALGMCLNIIQKEKQALFIEKIGLGNLSVDEANTAIATALKSLLLPQSFKDGSIEIAQTMVAKTDVKFDSQFLSLLQQVYDSELIVNDDIKTVVNAWVKEKTHGKISDVISEDNDIVFALVNAVYLNLTWQKKFKKPEQGWPVEQFVTADNKTAPVSMMSQKGNYPHFESETFSMLEVPYKAPDGRELSQVIFLPKPNCSLAQLEASMDAEMIRQCRAAAEKVYGLRWDMPKVNAESSFELTKILKSMDIPLDYLDNTKCSKEIYVDKVIHKTVVSNSEEGTKAAAVTAIIICEVAMAPIEIKEFIVDRAYAYLIMDKDTVLFRGRVSDASSLIVDP